MIWKIVGASALGTSHERTNKPCQDSFEAHYFFDDSKQAVYCFVSDGAGSAIEGGTGSKRVCETAVAYCIEQLKQVDLTEAFAYKLCEHLNELIAFEAQSVGLTSKDFSCTFLGLIIRDEKVLYLQIGDGAIVTRYDYDHPVYSVVFWPHKGEFANATYFITDKDYYKHLVVSLKDEVPSSFAVFTDGLEHLSLSNESRTVHGPFFNSMLLALRRAKNENDVSMLKTRLNQYLNSPDINDRTDDDKTLVLISREHED
jgi:hypothetical protein